MVAAEQRFLLLEADIDIAQQAAFENADVQAELDRTVSALQALSDNSSKEMQAMRTEHEVLHVEHDALRIKYETLCTDNESLRTRNEGLLTE